MTTSYLLAGGTPLPPPILDSSRSADRPATVDDEFGAGDVAALVAGEPQDAVGDIFRRGLVAERDGAFGELVQRRAALPSAIRAVLDACGGGSGWGCRRESDRSCGESFPHPDRI